MLNIHIWHLYLKNSICPARPNNPALGIRMAPMNAFWSMPTAHLPIAVAKQKVSTTVPINLLFIIPCQCTFVPNRPSRAWPVERANWSVGISTWSPRNAPSLASTDATGI
jgi:hypothetical protein